MQRNPARMWTKAAIASLLGRARAAQRKELCVGHSPNPAGRGRGFELRRLNLAVSGVFLVARLAFAEPFLPQDGSQVLEHLRRSAFDPGARELRGLRVRLAADSNNLALASRYVRKCLERSRNEADPRYLGRAQAALAPWWNSATVPAEALVLRATIRQAQHDFTNALSDLQLALNREPRNAQAWLTRSTILTVLGDYHAARHACLPLAQLAPGLVALTATASVSCLDGDAERGCALLRNALDAYPRAETSEKMWALTVLGEASTRLDRQREAEEYFKRALQLNAQDPYLLCAYADLLLDQGRAAQVVDVLKDGLPTDAVLLRLALAEYQLKPKPESLAIHLSTLAARFEAGHLRGDFVHQREEARFELRLVGKAREALRLAQNNWRVQREPADARILLESAFAAKDPAAAKPALEFIRNSHIQDVQLTKLAETLSP
jgi:tetratricopeptide (TPR) repeat protein